MTPSIRKTTASLAALVVAVVLAGCAADPTDVAAAKGVVYRADTVLDEVEAALQITSARTVQEFVEDNSIVPTETRPRTAGEFPLLNGVGASEADFTAHFPHSQADYPRDITVLRVDDPTSSVGTVQIFVRTAGKNQVGFDPNPYKVYFACLDVNVDVDARTVKATRSLCPNLPEVMIALGKPLSEARVATGDAWPRL